MRLRYTPEALAELDSVAKDLAEVSPQGLRRVLMRIHAVIDLLPDFPYRDRLTSLPSMRRLVATPYPYLIFYEVTDDEIVLIAVRHGARDPSSMPDRP